MKLSNEKIEVTILKEGTGKLSEGARVILVDNTSSVRIAKKKLYRRIVEQFDKGNCSKIGICSGDTAFIFAFKYTEDSFHPDYYCDIAMRISKYVFKHSDHTNKGQETSSVLTERGRAVLQKGKNKIDSIDVDGIKTKADNGLTKLADKLNGLNDYYNYNGEADEVITIDEEPEKSVPESVANTQKLELSNSEEKLDVLEEKSSEVQTYKNDESDELKKIERFKNSNSLEETLYTAEFENFKNGIFI